MSAVPDSRLRQALIVTGCAFALVAGAWLLVEVFHVLLLAFASAVLALLMRAPTDWLARHTGLSVPWALTLVLILAGAALVGAGWVFGQDIADQATQLTNLLTQLIDTLHDKLSDLGWLPSLDSSQVVARGAKLLSRGFSLVSTALGAVSAFALVLFAAVLFAAQPELYVRGFLHLVPKPRRARMREVVATAGHALRWWIVGQFMLMLLVGALTSTGLWLLGVQFPLALGILAGLFTFVPYLGPILSFIPAAMVAVSQAPMLGLYVGMLYIVVQTVEGVLEPVVQERVVHLPPVLILVSQLSLGVLAGLVGVMLSTPLTAFLLVVVKMLYVGDVLGDEEGARL